MEVGEQATVTDVIVEGRTTVTVAEPNFVESCVDVAVRVAVPAPDGVKTPEGSTVPPVADQVTPELKAPVPETVAEQLEVCVVTMEPGVQTTDTEVMVDGAVTVTGAEPNLVASCVEVAVTLAVPAPLGVNTPEEVIVPPVADQFTAELKSPVPTTVAVHAAVCVVVIEVGIHATITDVIVGGGGVTVIVADPDTFVYPACVELATQLPVPIPDGVNTPAELIVPPVAVQLTPELYAPVPWIVALQIAVCAVVMVEGRVETTIEVTTGGGTLTVTTAEPDTFV